MCLISCFPALKLRPLQPDICSFQLPDHSVMLESEGEWSWSFLRASKSFFLPSIRFWFCWLCYPSEKSYRALGLRPPSPSVSLAVTLLLCFMFSLPFLVIQESVSTSFFHLHFVCWWSYPFLTSEANFLLAVKSTILPWSVCLCMFSNCTVFRQLVKVSFFSLNVAKIETGSSGKLQRQWQKHQTWLYWITPRSIYIRTWSPVVAGSR